MNRFIAVLSLLLCSAATAYAGPPLIADDAGTVDVGKVEIELNSSYIHDRESVNGVSVRRDVFDGETKLTTGLYRNLGLSLALPYTFSSRVTGDGSLTGKADGFGDMTVELKYLFAEPAGISLVVKPSIILPTGNHGDGLSEVRWRFGGTLIASREFVDGTYALHVNLGYDHHDYRTEQARISNHSNLWFGSLAGEARVYKGLTTVAEFGLSTTQDNTTSELTGYAQVGARYEFNEYLDVSAGFKFGLTKPEDDLSVRYGMVLKF
ncbi:MAG: transporter [Deltaproteobacteria bacterium]|nr:transporter [Deltaproteobacteria bacterium]